MSTGEDYQGILVYSEFDGKIGPVVRAHHPETLYPDELKLLASMSMPNVGQQTNLDLAETSGFQIFTLDNSKVVYCYYKFLTGGVKTLTGASLVSLSFVTERLINPFRFKPFLELVLSPLFRVVVDSKVLRQIIESVASTGMIDKDISSKGPAIRVKARIIQDSELPLFYYELEKNLGRL